MRWRDKPEEDTPFFHNSVPLPPAVPYRREEVEGLFLDNATEQRVQQWNDICAVQKIHDPLGNPVALFDSMQPRTIVEGSAVQLLQAMERELPRTKFLAAKALLPLLLHEDSGMRSVFFTHGERSRIMGHPMDARDHSIGSIVSFLQNTLINHQEKVIRHAEATDRDAPSKAFQARDKMAMRAFLSLLTDVKHNTVVPVFLSQSFDHTPRSWHRGLMADYVAFKVGEELEQRILLGRGTYGIPRHSNQDAITTARMIVDKVMGYSQRGRSNAYIEQPIPPIAEILLDHRGLLTGADVVTLVMLAMEYNDEWAAAIV